MQEIINKFDKLISLLNKISILIHIIIVSVALFGLSLIIILIGLIFFTIKPEYYIYLCCLDILLLIIIISSYFYINYLDKKYQQAIMN